MTILLSSLVVSSTGSANDDVIIGADIAVTDITWRDMFGTEGTARPSITSGQPYSVSATVENLGSIPSGIFSLSLFIDDEPAGAPVTVDGLDGDEEAAVEWEGIVTSEAGEHIARAVAEPIDQEVANNELAEAFTVVNAQWTFAVYMDGDNNLEYLGHLDFIEMAIVGTSPAINIVVQFDRATGYNTSYGDWTDTRRFLVTQGMEPTPESAYEELGEVNMGDPDVLSDFATDTFTRFKAEKTCLVLWDHGGNWYRGCCFDGASQNDSLMNDEMRQALTETTQAMGSRVDVIAFDACIMSSVEVAYAFRGLCVDFVASMSYVPGLGFPYDAILQWLDGAPGSGPDQLCEVMVSEYAIEYEGNGLSILAAFRVDDICNGVADALSAFGDALIAGGSDYLGRIHAARSAADGFDLTLLDSSYRDSYSADLYLFVHEVAERINDEPIQDAAAGVLAALDAAKIGLGLATTYHYWADVFGILVFFPEQPLYQEEYADLDLSLDTSWDEFVLYYWSQ